jgi:hypothetical protein
MQQRSSARRDERIGRFKALDISEAVYTCSARQTVGLASTTCQDTPAVGVA